MDAKPHPIRPLRFFWNGIYGRALLLCLAILVPILMVQAEIYRDRFRTHRRAERQTNIEVARGVAETFDQFVTNILTQELAIGVALTASERPSSEAIRRILSKSQDEFATIRNLGWISPEGRLLHVSDPFALGLDVSQHPYFQVILSGRNASVSDLFVSPFTGKPAFTISRGVRDDTGKLLGVVAAMIEPDMLRQLYPKKRDQNRSFFLVDNLGRGVFLSSRMDWPWEDRNLLESFPALQDTLKGREHNGTMIATRDGIAKMVAFTPIPRIGWAAGASIAASEALAPIHTQLKKHAALFLLALMFALLTAWWFALRSIGRPLKALQQFARELSESRLASRMGPVGPHEFQDLGRALNVMADDIARWTARSENAYRRLRVVLDTVPVGIVMARADTREITFANPESRRIMGGTLAGTVDGAEPHAYVLLRPDGTPFPRNERPLHRSLKSGEIISGVEILVKRPGGGACMVSVNAAPIRDKDERIWGAVASLTDITERKKAEEALRKSEMQFREAFAHLPVGMVINDLAGRFIHVNEAYCRITGYTEEELLRSDFQGLTHPDDLGVNLEEMQKLLAGAIPAFFVEKRYLLRGGKTVWVRASATLRRDMDGKPVQILGLVEDISDRKKAERALRESEARWNAAIEHFAEGAIIATEDEQTLYWNPAARQMHGIIPTDLEALESPLDTFQLWTPDGARRLALDEWPMRRIKRGETVRHLELRIRRPDRNWEKIFSYSGAMVVMPDGERLIFLSCSDLTELRRAEAALKATLGEKEVLLKEIHHRVKNNMQVISSLISLQQNDLQRKDMYPVFQDLVNRVRSMALVHEKLYHSPDLAHVAFADYAESLLDYLWRAHAAAPGVRLVLDLRPVALSATAAVPCGLMLNELVSNALKHAFTGREGGEVRVSLESAPAGRVRLSVRDNGKGLPQGFDWRQARSLGLRLVQMLERQLHAVVDVDAGRGTVFTITFEEKTP